MIKAEVVADSLSPQGDRLTSLLITFPRIILAEVNTHRMLSKNTSSSRAIPFNKMVEVVQNNPFIPIAWQKEHKGMQGSEYITEKMIQDWAVEKWLEARDCAIQHSKILNTGGVTKQFCNRLLEPFMWTTMLITGSKEGWNNFFSLRCPQYSWSWDSKLNRPEGVAKSKKEYIDWSIRMGSQIEEFKDKTDLDWLQINKGQAEIHMMALAEAIYDAINESAPKQLKEGEWHIPFYNKIISLKVDMEGVGTLEYYPNSGFPNEIMNCVEISTAMAARTSYTVVGDEKEIDHKKMLELHDKLVSQNPPHSSPMEHCARAMSNHEYYYKFGVTPFSEADKKGWCRNFRGFIQYRHIIETKK